MLTIKEFFEREESRPRLEAVLDSLEADIIRAIVDAILENAEPSFGLVLSTKTLGLAFAGFFDKDGMPQPRFFGPLLKAVREEAEKIIEVKFGLKGTWCATIFIGGWLPARTLTITMEGPSFVTLTPYTP